VFCSQMEYENHNQINPRPLRLSGIQGAAEDDTGTKLWSGCVGVFSKDGSQLIATAKIQPDGSFMLSGLAKGEYVLVARARDFALQIMRSGLAPRFEVNEISLLE